MACRGFRIQQCGPWPKIFGDSCDTVMIYHLLNGELLMDTDKKLAQVTVWSLEARQAIAVIAEISWSALRMLFALVRITRLFTSLRYTVVSGHLIHTVIHHRSHVVGYLVTLFVDLIDTFLYAPEYIWNRTIVPFEIIKEATASFKDLQKILFSQESGPRNILKWAND